MEISRTPCILNNILKRYLRKHRKNVIDPTTVSPIISLSLFIYSLIPERRPRPQVAIRAKLEKQREERRKELEAKKRGTSGAEDPGMKKKSALDRFKRANAA